MKIKLLTSIAGDGFNFAYGEITSEIKESTAKALIEKGQAEEIKPAKKALLGNKKAKK